MKSAAFAWGLLGGTIALAIASPVIASPAAPVITVDRTFGRVAGWSVGYSGSLGGCLAAATYQDGTTIWFGFGAATDRAFLAFTNVKWRSIEVGQSYDIHLLAHGGSKWRGAFAGFERNGEKGIFTSSLKDQFVSDLAEAGGLDVTLDSRRVAMLSLVGSSDAFAAVARCQKESATLQAGGDANTGSAAQAPEAAASQAADAETRAQQASAVGLKAERLAQAREVADRVLVDGASFVKANGDDPQVLEHVERIAALKTALQGGEPAPVERGAAELSATLAADPIYTAYAARREVERRRENARYLDDAVATLKTQKTFLMQDLIRDPTSEHAADFLVLRKQAETVIAAPDLDRAKTVMGLIDAAIDKNDLRAGYALAKASAAAVPVSDATAAKTSDLGPSPAVDPPQ